MIFLNPFASWSEPEIGFFKKLFYTFNGRWNIQGNVRWISGEGVIEDLYYYKFHIGIYDYLTLGLPLCFEQIPIIGLIFTAARFFVSGVMALIAIPFFLLSHCIGSDPHIGCCGPRKGSGSDNEGIISNTKIRKIMPEQSKSPDSPPTEEGVAKFFDGMMLQHTSTDRGFNTLKFLNRQLPDDKSKVDTPVTPHPVMCMPLSPKK